MAIIGQVDELTREVTDADGLDGSGYSPELSQRYLYGSTVDEILAVEDSAGDVLWGLADHEATIRDLVDSTGTVQEHRQYDTFGQITSPATPTPDFPFPFTGRPLDADTGVKLLVRERLSGLFWGVLDGRSWSVKERFWFVVSSHLSCQCFPVFCFSFRRRAGPRAPDAVGGGHGARLECARTVWRALLPCRQNDYTPRDGLCSLNCIGRGDCAKQSLGKGDRDVEMQS